VRTGHGKNPPFSFSGRRLGGGRESIPQKRLKIQGKRVGGIKKIRVENGI
jgi:hypothetical protein